MAIVVDTGVLIAKHSRKDPNRVRAMEIVGEILEGIHGTPYISDHLLGEAVNYAIGRAKTPRMAMDILDDVLGSKGPRWLVMVQVDDQMFADAIAFFRATGSERGLSMTDCTSVVVARRFRAKRIASFDGGFDGFLERVS